MEDKKCRICGLADMANNNIFQVHSKLVEKIVAVFPIILYRNDPLPQNICKKCIISTNSMYAEIEKALKNQSKWITNVRAIAPDNSFVKVVDVIENGNKKTSQLASQVAGTELGERAICRMSNLKFDDQNSLNKLSNNIKHDHSPHKNLSPVPSGIELGDNTISKINQPEISLQTSFSKPSTPITQLKSVLELNGCTLTKLNSTITTPTETEITNNYPIDEIKIEIKEEPIFYEEEYSEPTENRVYCKRCSYNCETVEELAIHQLDHLSISLPKLYERRFLDKRIRRGRLIRIEEKKCIRCLNCWRVFVDNKSILHHWSAGDCDFFCQICGKEFASSPKMLREHIPAAHGISYRSSKILRPPTLVPRKPIKTEKSPDKPEVSPRKKETKPKIKGTKEGVDNLSIKVTCSICLKVFANFKARNSHMRAHKHPPFLPAQPPPPLAETLLAFNRSNLMQIKSEPQDYDIIPQQHTVAQQRTAIPSITKVIPTLTSGSNATIQSQRLPHSKAIPNQKMFTLSNQSPKPKEKRIQIRHNPSSVVFKTEPNTNTTALKVKSLVDLQDPSISSQLPEDSNKTCPRITDPNETLQFKNDTPSSNGQSVSNQPKDNMNYDQMFHCRPCGGKFPSKLELFRHKRKCSAHNMFPCEFCTWHFMTSADLQMHIMLMHKSSGTQ